MRNRRLIASSLLALALTPAPTRLDGQGVGGLIKKKVTESVKRGDTKAQTGAPDAGAAQGATQSGSKLPRSLSEITLVAFKKGLTAEREHQLGTIKFLATIKTREQYQACTQQVAMSPEGQKIVMAFGNLPENATPEQAQKASEKMGADLAKLVEQKCGEDPGKYPQSWKQEKLKEARAAGVKAFAAALAAPAGSSGPFFAFEQQQDDNYFYDLLKEWTPPFCRLPLDAQKAAAANGVSVPGSGKGIAYVYTAMEARLLIPQCEELMRLLAVLE